MDILSPDTAPKLAGLIKLAQQFLRFGTVGAMGFVVDFATVSLLKGEVGPFWAGYMAFPVAATFTWLVNRMWTFRGQGSGPVHRQWAKFLATNAVGFVLNRGTYTLMILFVPFAAAHLIVALFAGTLAGMFVNFHLSRSVVFK
jgi:putative flippase GtrA